MNDILPLLRERYSARAFLDRAVEPDQLRRVFEAARWSPSCFNDQPWVFIVASKQSNPEAYAAMLATLVPKNQEWARHAPVLGYSVARAHFNHNQKPNRWGGYDTGQAIAHLNVQAHAEGLNVHQMGGFDADQARAVLGIPADHEPIAAFALGYADETADRKPGSRKPLAEVVFEGHWNKSLFS